MGEFYLDFSYRGGALVGMQSKQSNAKSGHEMIQRHSREMNQVQVMGGSVNPLFRSESFGFGSSNNYNADHNYYTMNNMMEKRQLFLRSYQFCRKKSLTERIKGSLVRVKRVVWLRLRSARRLRKLVFSRFKCGFYYRRRRFFRLLNTTHNRKNQSFSSSTSSSSSCFW